MISPEEADMATANVRYIVNDVEAAMGFYAGTLGFEVEMHPAPGFAMLRRGALRLMLSGVGGGGGAVQPMPDGRVPEPGGWNRVQIEVDDIEAAVGSLRAAGAPLRNEIVQGQGGRQVLVD